MFDKPTEPTALSPATVPEQETRRPIIIIGPCC